MKPINTHEDLLNAWYNVENPEFNVYDDRKPNIVIETNRVLYNITNIESKYIIEKILNYKLHSLKIGQRPPRLEFEELARVYTPQAVYDYFKPFIKDRNNGR